MNHIKLVNDMKIEKAKRKAQSMIWESFSGTNGIQYANCFDNKTKTNLIYIHHSDKQAIENYNKNFPNIEIKLIPDNFKHLASCMSDNHWVNGFKHGALYLPYPYLCSQSNANGRFSGEQYYWDSYLFVLSLLSFNQIEDAKGIVLNLCYQLDYYGMILNGNRTYYFWRSQPPLLSSMVMAIYTYLERFNKKEAYQWIDHCKIYIEKEFDIWERFGFKCFNYKGEKIILASYFDTLNKICPEAIDEPYYLEEILGIPIEFSIYNEIIGKYPNLIEEFIAIKGNVYFKRNIKDSNIFNEFSQLYVSSTKNTMEVRHDNSNRASGFDPNYVAFEKICADIIPVCLNSLLYKTVSDLEMISNILQNGSEIHKWSSKKNIIQRNINSYLWNNNSKVYQNRDISGNFTKEPFISMVYPLMFGLSTQEKAKNVVSYVLENFVTDYGIKNTLNPDKDQWDHIWGIMNYFCNKALRMYNYKEEAFSVSTKFINNVVNVFTRTGTFFEKYNPENGSEFFNNKHYGNQEEFSWTAASYLTLLARLSV